MTLVAGIDSSTQSCKVVVRDADSGALVRHGAAPHPPGTEVDPEAWWDALLAALAAAGGLADVAAVSVAGQQHGLICLDDSGRVIRPALLWNDTRSGEAAEQLVAELGDGDSHRGARLWARSVGTVPVASLTVTKLRWLADHEPHHAQRIAAVALPHDWLTWRLTGATSLDSLTTDRSDASGTGYFDAVTNVYRPDLLALALKRDETEAQRVRLPRVLGAHEEAGRGDAAWGLGHLVVGPGCGDNAGAALGLGLRANQTIVSVGTSGVVASVSDTPSADPTGLVAGFADATGRYLPLACTLNGSRILETCARTLGVDRDEFSLLALAGASGAGGLIYVPYLEGERTPNLPDATGELHGITLSNLTRANLARAAVEGLLGLLGHAMAALRDQGAVIERVSLIGGGARSEAVRALAPAVWGLPVDVPAAGEDVADGAARQAAWVLAGTTDPPAWSDRQVRTYTAQPTPAVQTAHDAAAALVMERYRAG
jgi:xylulokinase